MNKKRNILTAVLILPMFACLGLFLFIGLHNNLVEAPEVLPDSPEEEISSSLFLSADQRIEGLELIEYRQSPDGVEKDFVITAEKLETKSPRFGIFRINLGKIIELKEPRITLYKDNHPYKYISAKNGILDPVNKKIELDGKEFSIGGEK